MIGAVGTSGYGYWPAYVSGATVGAAKTALETDLFSGEKVNPVAAVPAAFSNAETERVTKSPAQKAEDVDNAKKVMESGASDKLKKRLGLEKCETCENRKYVDGSDENDVSFKTPGHIDPSAAASQVSAHERMHVANAIEEGNKPDAKLLSVSVQLHTAICPECGKVYVSGGTTRTQMQHTADGSDIDEARKAELTGWMEKDKA